MLSKILDCLFIAVILGLGLSFAISLVLMNQDFQSGLYQHLLSIFN